LKPHCHCRTLLTNALLARPRPARTGRPRASPRTGTTATARTSSRTRSTTTPTPTRRSSRTRAGPETSTARPGRRPAAAGSTGSRRRAKFARAFPIDGGLLVLLFCGCDCFVNNRSQSMFLAQVLQRPPFPRRRRGQRKHVPDEQGGGGLPVGGAESLDGARAHLLVRALTAL
jgi:hypothetical protein